MGDHTLPSELPDFFIGGIAIWLTLALIAGGATDLWVQTLLHLGLLGLGAAALARRPAFRSPSKEFRRLWTLWLLFFICLILSVNRSGAPDASQQILRNWGDAFLVFWITTLFSSRQKNHLLSLLYIPWTFLLLDAFHEAALHRTPQASLLNPNLLAGVIVLPFFLTLHRLRKSTGHAALYVLWAASGAIILMLTASIGAWLSIAAALAYAVFPARPARNWRSYVYSASALFVFTALLAWKLHAGWDEHRWSWWKACGEMIAAHPFFGNGAGTFEIGLPHSSAMGLYSFYAHNTWLQWFSENGVLAAVLLAGIIFYSLKRQKNRWLRAAVIGVIVHNLIDSDLMIPAQALTFWLWMALPWESPLESHAEAPSGKGLSSFRPLLYLSAAAVGVISLQRFRADQAYASAVNFWQRQAPAAVHQKLQIVEQLAPDAPDAYGLNAQTVLSALPSALTRSTLQLALAYERMAIEREPLQARFLSDALRLCHLLALPDQAHTLMDHALARYPFLHHDKRIQINLAD